MAFATQNISELILWFFFFKSKSIQITLNTVVMTTISLTIKTKQYIVGGKKNFYRNLIIVFWFLYRLDVYCSSRLVAVFIAECTVYTKSTSPNPRMILDLYIHVLQANRKRYYIRSNSHIWLYVLSLSFKFTI